MQSLHEGAVSAPDILRARARLHAKNLIGLLLRHFAAPPRPAIRARCRVGLRVFTPAGLAAVEICHQERTAFLINVAEKPGQRRDVERVEYRSFMPSREDAPTHRAAVMIELHLDESRAHPRHLAGALARARYKPGHAPRQPAKQPEPGEAERNGNIEAPANPQHARNGESAQTTSRFQHHGSGLRVDLSEGIERP